MVIPSRIGRFEIREALGAGGMGVVYRARDTRLDRDVALKVLADVLSADTDAVRRFEQEARAASALNHPNIVTVYDAGVDEGTAYLVTELLQGTTLRERSSRGDVRPTDTLEIAIQIAAGLAAAHRAGIVHRDIKPHNNCPTLPGERCRRSLPVRGRPSTVVPASARPIAPAVSPDGKWVTYVGLAGGEANLYVQYLNGGPPVNLTRGLGLPLQTRTVVGGIDVLPDGSGIGVAADRARPACGGCRAYG